MKGQRKTYLVHLVIDEAVIDCGFTDNCRHALREAYHRLSGIPNAEATVRVEGELMFDLTTNWRGEMWSVEFLKRHRTYIETVHLNPLWKGWPVFDNTLQTQCVRLPHHAH